jgi:8-oxo-dGTP diphosphatase
MSADRPTIVVVAAVVERDGRLLVTRRLANTHLPGFWEFPGGKCEPSETHEACLARELREELDVSAEVGAEILRTEHAYDDRIVRLHFRWCAIDRDPQPMLGQDMQWVTREELRTLRLPPADDQLVDLLSPPAR